MTEIQTRDPYHEIMANIDAMELANSKLSFDYHDKAGNRNARSHISQLKKVNGSIEARRKELKADSLAYGRKVDESAKILKGRIAPMIALHQGPIDKITEAALEISKAQDQCMTDLKKIIHGGMTEKLSANVETWIEELDDFKITKTRFGPQLLPAELIKVGGMQSLEERQTELAQHEEQQALAEKQRKQIEALKQEQVLQAEVLKKQQEAIEHSKREAERAQEAAEVAQHEADEKLAHEKQKVVEEQEKAAQATKDAELAAAEAEKRKIEAVQAEKMRILEEERDAKEAEEALKAEKLAEAEEELHRIADCKARREMAIADIDDILAGSLVDDPGVNAESIFSAIEQGTIRFVRFNQ